MRCFLLVLCLLPLLAHAQGARLAADDGPLYETVERLQRRGLLLDLHPTLAPYTHDQIHDALDRLDAARLRPVEQRWIETVRRSLPPSTAGGATTALLEIGGGTVATNNERLDVMRWTDAEEAVVEAAGVNVYPNAVFRASMAHGPLAVQLGARLDVFYEDDPDGLDVVNTSVFLRNQEAYATASGRWAEATLGTVARHWGLPSGEGLFVSHNPRPFDAVTVRLGGERFAVRSVVAELDAATPDGRFTGRVGDDSRETPLRRYLFAHRIDWRPKPWLLIAGMESMLSSGSGAGTDLAALLPASVLSFLNDGPPVNTANNGLVGGLFWLQRGRVTVYGQAAFDDFDLFNRAEPASVAVTGQVTVAALAGGRVDAGLDVTAVTARTYNTLLPEQSYVFALRGIGTQFGDFVHLRAGADVYVDEAVPGLSLRPEVQVLWQGEADFREPFPANTLPLILVGDAERTLRIGSRIGYAPSPHVWVRADVGVNVTVNDGWIRGRERSRLVAVVEAGARWRLGGAFSPDL